MATSTAGFQVNPVARAPLAMVTLPSIQGINPGAFAGDTGESYVRGISAGQALAAPLAQAALELSPERVAEKLLERKRMEQQGALSDLTMEKMKQEMADAKEFGPIEKRAREAKALETISESDFNRAVRGNPDAMKNVTETNRLKLEALNTESQKAAAELEQMKSKFAQDTKLLPTDAEIARKRELEGKLNDLALSKTAFEQSVYGGGLSGFNEADLTRARNKIKGIPDYAAMSEEAQTKELSRRGKFKPGMTQEERNVELQKAEEKPLTESQGKELKFADLMRANNDIVNKVDTKKFNPAASLLKGDMQRTSLVPGILTKIPGVGLPNALKTDEQQSYEAAKEGWIAAHLRDVSGAAISNPEYTKADAQFFPQSGDSEKVIKQKADLRKLTEENTRTGAGANAVGAYKGTEAPKTEVAPTSSILKQYTEEQMMKIADNLKKHPDDPKAPQAKALVQQYVTEALKQKYPNGTKGK